MTQSYPDDIVHGDEDNPDNLPHEMSVNCWCKPVRQRFNQLTRVWEIWDRDLGEWHPVEGEQPPPNVGHPMPTSAITEAQIREGMRVEDDFWKGVD